MSEATFLSIKPDDEKICSGAQLFELPVVQPARLKNSMKKNSMSISFLCLRTPLIQTQFCGSKMV